MSKHHVFSNDHEQLGQMFLDIRHAINSEAFFPVFERHGLGEIDPEAWFPLQNFLDVLNEIEEQGGMFDLISIGKKIGEDIDIPDDMRVLPFFQLLNLAPEIYKMHNRGSDIGWILVEEVDDKHHKLILCVPDPDDLWYGIFYGFSRRHLPSDQRFSIYYDPDEPRRNEGGSRTILHLKLDS